MPLLPPLPSLYPASPGKRPRNWATYCLACCRETRKTGWILVSDVETSQPNDFINVLNLSQFRTSYFALASLLFKHKHTFLKTKPVFKVFYLIQLSQKCTIPSALQNADECLILMHLFFSIITSWLLPCFISIFERKHDCIITYLAIKS